MSMELHVLLPRSTVIEHATWQAAIDRLALPLRVGDGAPMLSTGFYPMMAGGRKSGVEVTSGPIDEILADYPDQLERFGEMGFVMSFRWGGDLVECGCAMGAAAALIGSFGGIGFFPDDDLIYEQAERLADEARPLLSEAPPVPS